MIREKSYKVWYFEKTFLLASISIKVVEKMLFLALNNADIKFNTESILWRFYITVKALSIVKRVERIDKYNFAEVDLDNNSGMFIVHVAILKFQS